MSYIINKTDGSILTTIQDGTLQGNIGITLIGRNVPSYGNIQNQNFVRLTENFASTIPPTLSSQAFTPMTGTLWYDTGTKRMRVYDGATWAPTSEQTSANVAPTTYKVGDQWWDTVRNQLTVWNGNAWALVGPTFSSIQGKSGVFPETILDFQFIPQPHLALNTYVGNALSHITSVDSAYTIDPLPEYDAYDQILPGINLPSGSYFNGDATNSLQLGNIGPEGYARKDITTQFTADIRLDGTLVIGHPDQGNANVYYSNRTLTIQNSNYLDGIGFYVNSVYGNIAPLRIDGTTGLVSVYADPISSTGVATKNYVDSSLVSVNDSIDAVALTSQNNLLTVQQGLQTQIDNNYVFGINQLTANVNPINTSIANLGTYANVNFTELYSNAQQQSSTIVALQSNVALTARLVSPTFTGTPTVPNAAPATNSNIIASTAYVDGGLKTLNNNFIIMLNDLGIKVNSNIAGTAAIFANIASPQFTGVPRAPTATTGNNSSMIATTQFVTTAIAAQKFNYTVSSSPPTGGNDGDFWFQVG